jgi:hypothetical protein
MFPAEYKGSAFVAMHGSWNRGKRTGYKVVRLLFDESGKPTGAYEDFMTGMVASDNDVWGRPVGVAVGLDGSLFVSEDGNGSIWRIAYGESANGVRPSRTGWCRFGLCLGAACHVRPGGWQPGSVSRYLVPARGLALPVLSEPAEHSAGLRAVIDAMRV